MGGLNCEICGTYFETNHPKKLTCSKDCSVDLRRQRNREWIKNNYPENFDPRKKKFTSQILLNDELKKHLKHKKGLLIKRGKQ